MATYGKIGEFDPNTEEWPLYVERLGHYFEANDITEGAKKRAILLSVVGPATFKLLHGLLAPQKPGDKEYSEIVDVLKKHYSPAPSEIVQRYKFHTRIRQGGESVAMYVAELRTLAEFCNFGSTLDLMLRDRLVCGINDERTQRRLLSETELTFKKALEIAQGLEAAAKNAQELQGTTMKRAGKEDTSEVHLLKGNKNGRAMANPEITCYRCGKAGHVASRCRHQRTKCHNCGKVGHLRSVCRSKPQRQPTQTNQEKEAGSTFRPVKRLEEKEEPAEYRLLQLGGNQLNRPIEVTLVVEGQQVDMELDTGASLSLVSEETYRKNWPNILLQESSVSLRTYSGERIPVIGKMEVDICYGEQHARVPLCVVKGSGPSLLGRDWLRQIRLDWKKIHHFQESSLEETLRRHKVVFQPGLGTLKGYQAKIHVDKDAQPKFCKARPVPYAMRARVEEELDRLVSEGILEPVQFSDWAAPIVPVMKSDGKSIRVCGDFKQTVNRASKLDRYPIPKIEDLLTKLAGGKTFSKLDMSQAYQQLELDDESRQYVVINTHKGLFKYTRLPFGVSSAPGIFQRVMESLLQGISGVVVYLDDILVTGRTEKEHLEALKEVLSRLEKAGLRLKQSKCSFMRPSVIYLGYKIDSSGLHPVAEKVKAVVDAPKPRNVPELKSYLGLLTYYGRFLPNLSSVLSPLYSLLRREKRWCWTRKEQEAFQASKDLLMSSQVLVHFNPELELVLACDASSYGIGAVLSHKMPDGTEKPIGFASRTLSTAERNYSQIEKEGLACVFGVTRFHSYIYGRHFELQTDHKPLLTLFSERQAISPQASSRIQRWALTLSMYEYHIVFKPTAAHGNADAMSRLPLPETPEIVPIPAEVVLMMDHLEGAPVSAAQIRMWTGRDPLLAKVRHMVKQGWPESVEAEMKPYARRKLELSIQDECILWGSRVIIPPQGRAKILQELHESHPGMARMKGLARMYMWWPGMDNEIEKTVRSCAECQKNRALPPVAPMQPWKWPERPWSRIHLDFAGPFLNRMFLVLVDAHSKWMEVFPMSCSTSSATIQQLRTIFARFGLPETIVTDNGPCFTSAEFAEFMQNNGIHHVTSAPYHPSTNGLAERAVQVLKEGLKKIQEGTLTDRLAKLLFNYRLTPHSTTGVSPAELLFGRTLRSRLDLLRPNLAKRVEKRQQAQKQGHDSHAHSRKFEAGDKVYVQNFCQGERWLVGQIEDVTGPLSYKIRLEDKRLVRRHQDHIRHRSDVTTAVDVTEVSSEEASIPQGIRETPESMTDDVVTEQPPVQGVASETVPTTPQQTSPKCYPSRNRKPPDRFQPEL